MTRRRIAVVTGTRAEFGLLTPIIEVIRRHDRLDLDVAVTGTHLLPPAMTVNEVERATPVAVRIPMQAPGRTGRAADAAALGRGVSGFAEWLAGRRPDVVVVLGDRIEAFAAAQAAAVGGIRVAHLHGGDRAEGIADEALRHAISKLAHIHLPATQRSADRLHAMGEDAERIHVVGSPAIDGLAAIEALDDDRYQALGAPRLVMLLHPTGLDRDDERRVAERLLAAAQEAGPVLALHPNHDPGREGIVDAIEASAAHAREHLPRGEFIGLLRRVSALVGNSSAGLIECAALGVPCVNVGTRQAGRERGANVVDAGDDARRLTAAIADAAAGGPRHGVHPYGDGRTGDRVAAILSTFDPAVHRLTKRNTY